MPAWLLGSLLAGINNRFAFPGLPQDIPMSCGKPFLLSGTPQQNHKHNCMDTAAGICYHQEKIQ
ncbi:hypothetical protein DXA36_06645 [Eisenbergiella sp. OF01-20]|nr:hypothetical protein DXA36_06645 [Eisenbergiella sp. OF01-20]